MMKRPPKCTIVIVTHDSEKFIHKAIECVNSQTHPPHQIVLVDSGSNDLSYLNPYWNQPNLSLILAGKEIGFCKANNIGIKKISQDSDYVFFLNPDAFLTPTFLEHAISYMEDPKNQRCGALTGTVLGYDMEENRPKTAYDTTGVFRTWYGKWFDRGQGMPFSKENYSNTEEVPAICGAVMFCRKTALDSVLLRNVEVFDNSFYMYKEDIDLSLRLSKKGWKLVFVPELIAYHCRGWQRDRTKMPRNLRLASARNELRIQTRLLKPIPIAYSMLKYAAVKLLDM